MHWILWCKGNEITPILIIHVRPREDKQWINIASCSYTKVVGMTAKQPNALPGDYSHIWNKGAWNWISSEAKWPNKLFVNN